MKARADFHPPTEELSRLIQCSDTDTRSNLIIYLDLVLSRVVLGSYRYLVLLIDDEIKQCAVQNLVERNC